MKWKNIIVLVLIFLYVGVNAKHQPNSDSLYIKAQFLIYKDPNAAIKLLQNVLKTEQDLQKKSRQYLLLALAYMAKRDFDQSLYYTNKAQDVMERFSNPKEKVLVYNSIANLYQQMGVFNKSLEALDQAEELLKKIDDLRYKNFQYGRIFAIRGMVYKAQNNPDLALSKFLKSAEYFGLSSDKRESSVNLSVVYYNIGYCYFDLKKLDLSISYFNKALKVAEVAKTKSLEAYALKGLAEPYTLQGKNTEALMLLEKAKLLSKSVGDLTLNEGIYKGFTNNYLALKDMEYYEVYNALYYKMKFEREQNEMSSINQAIDLSSAKTKKSENELRLRFHRYILTLILLTSVVLLFLSIKIWKKKRSIKKWKEKLSLVNHQSEITD